MQVGGGGLNGNIPPNLAVVRFWRTGRRRRSARPPYPLSRGYAMFGGDSGHQGTAANGR